VLDSRVVHLLKSNENFQSPKMDELQLVAVRQHRLRVFAEHSPVVVTPVVADQEVAEVIEQVAEEVAEEVAEQVPEQVPEQVAEQVPEQVPEQAAEQVAEQVAEPPQRFFSQVIIDHGEVLPYVDQVDEGDEVDAEVNSSGRKPRLFGYLKELDDGVNYRIIPGKLRLSKIVVCGKYGYLVDRKKDCKDSNPKFYLKCKFPRCKARGFIKNKFLTLQRDNNDHPHTCDLDGGGACEARWAALSALARMKERALKERSTFEVS